jgi:hypothetical protein
MIWVHVLAAEGVGQALGRGAALFPHVFACSPRPSQACITVRLGADPSGPPWRVERCTGVTVNLSQSAGISSYAGLDEGLYLLLLAALGLLQYRALEKNPLLRAEDFLHPPHATCLYARGGVEELALALEQPKICRGCRVFYESLCGTAEVEAVRRIVEHVAGQISGERGPVPEAGMNPAG